MIQNPFSIVKATEYSDSQIADYWVPFGEESIHDQSFYDLMQPQAITPKLVLGSKGCGKTHMLRYYSFECRLAHYNGDLRKLLQEDKYIGFYSRLDGLSSSRFCPSASKENPDAWQAMYDYYFELYHSIVALQFIKQIVESLEVPESIINETIDYICTKSGIDKIAGGISAMITYLESLRIDIDKEIRLFAHTRTLNTEKIVAKFNYGSLIFDIPSAFTHRITELKEINVIYILDEYEKLQEEWQKRSLNTLIYERRENVTLWIGARKTGYTTRDTKMKEQIRDGHEYALIDLDMLLKNNEKAYQDFANRLFVKRLEKAHYAGIKGEDLFDEYDENQLIEALRGKDLKHWARLREVLRRINCSLDGINNIIRGLLYEVQNDPIEQKGKLYAFYLKWNERKGINEEQLIEIVASVNEEYKQYKAGANKKYKERVDKFKQDFRAQLALENKVKIYQHSGFKELINVSDCNPRVFLTLIKLIIDDSLYKGIHLFEEGVTIPVTSQYAGMNETARWYLNDIEVYGEDRENLSLAINNLIQILHDYRFCDKPIETSLCTFYFREEKGLTNAKRIIDLAVNEAFLIETKKPRKDKSLGTYQRTYQLNRLLATLYDLPTARRGIKPFQTDMLLAIFDPEHQSEFRRKEGELKKTLNAPFGEEPEIKVKNQSNELTLFALE